MAGVKGKSGGRNRKPLRHRELVGERHKTRLGKGEPDRVEGPVLPLVKLDEVGQRVFDYYAPMLEKNGTMSQADALAFTMLCRKVSDWYRVAARLGPDDLTVMGQFDEKIAPLANLEIRLYDQVVKIMREFGITPVARSAVQKIGKGETVLPFAGVTG